MPIISQFYGIIIKMFFNDEGQHHLPHIHVEYNNYKATFDFNANKLSGKIPRAQSKLVEAWIIIHKEELENLWNKINNDDGWLKIEPLK